MSNRVFGSPPETGHGGHCGGELHGGQTLRARAKPVDDPRIDARTPIGVRCLLEHECGGKDGRRGIAALRLYNDGSIRQAGLGASLSFHKAELVFRHDQWCGEIGPGKRRSVIWNRL